MSVIKILHSADWHLGAPLSLRDEGQAALLRQWLNALPGWIAEVCQQEQCDLMLLSGDLLDGPVSPDILNQLAQIFRQVEIPVFISPGNHDHMGAGSPWDTQVWPENVHIFTRPALEAVTLKEPDCRVYGAGFAAMDCPGLLEGFYAPGDVGCNLAVLHGDPTQLHAPCNPITRQQVSDSNLTYLALGHIHKAGTFRTGKTLCAWPGCPQGRGYDETGEKGIYIVTVEDTAQTRFVPYPGPRFYELTVDADTSLDTVLPAAGSEDFYRITFTGEAEPLDLEQLRSGYSHFPNLVLRDHTQPPEDLWGNAGTDTFEGMYFRLLKETMEKASAEDARLIRLAAKLSRQLMNDQEVVLP